MEWISVKDKVPEVGKICVTWLSKRKEPSCCRFESDENGPLWIDLVEVDRYCEREDVVTHWIPLPEDPKI